MRLLWRWTHRLPPLPAGYRAREVAASHATHLLLCAPSLAMPLSGWIMASAWRDAGTHPMRLFGLLYGLFGLHVAGALKHRWIDRAPGLQRMLPNSVA